MAKKKKGGKDGIENIKTFAVMAEFLRGHEEIEWEQKQIGLFVLELQGSCYENEKRYWIKLTHAKEKGGAGISYHGVSLIGCRAAPDWWNYKYGVTVTLNKVEVVGFSGEASFVSLSAIDKILTEKSGKPFLAREDFIQLFDEFAGRVRTKKNQKIVYLGKRR